MKRIKDLTVRGIGTYGVQQDAPVADAASEFIAKKISALIVYGGEQIVGIFTQNDLVRCYVNNPDGIRGLKVRDFMKENLFTTTEGADLDAVIEIMIEKGFRHVPVLRDGKPVGMVTSVDILMHQRTHLDNENEQMRRYIHGSY